MKNRFRINGQAVKFDLTYNVISEQNYGVGFFVGMNGQNSI